ncbi:MAG: hypothetical protein PHY28_10255, partial [Dehalococcoidales bacterium]|nr:hypothetical protein [Dehalococcoidales bacterium]
VWYAVCPDSLISTHLFYHLISLSRHSPTCKHVGLCPSGFHWILTSVRMGGNGAGFPPARE